MIKRWMMLFGCVLMVAGGAWAQASHHTTPLLIVRFNQERLHYQRPLYNVVSQAVEAKPSVQFALVSVVPLTNSDDYNKQMQQKARGNTNQLVQQMLQMGVPQERVSVEYRNSADVRANEVQIYVR